jgi:hypothetical protein
VTSGWDVTQHCSSVTQSVKSLCNICLMHTLGISEDAERNCDC